MVLPFSSHRSSTPSDSVRINPNSSALAPSLPDSLVYHLFAQPLSSVSLIGCVLVTVMLAYLSDRYKTRAIPLISVCLIAVAGYSTYLGSSSFPFFV